MAQSAQRVRIEEADWPSVLPFIRLFRCFRMAISPAKLFTALLLIVLLYVAGRALDEVWGKPVFPDEVHSYTTHPLDEYQAWLQEQPNDLDAGLVQAAERVTQDLDALRSINGPDAVRNAVGAVNQWADARRQAILESAKEHSFAVDERLKSLSESRRAVLEQINAIAPRGIFDSILRFTLDFFERLIGGTIALNLGLTDVLRGLPPESASVAGALRDLCVTLPGWLYHTHCGFLAVYCVVAGLLWGVFGGALCRMAALHAVRDQRFSPPAALQFALRRLVWLILAPLIPVFLAVGLAGLLFLAGFLGFGIPYLHVVLDILGALFFVIPLALGLVIALVALGLVLGGNLLYPAIAVEGSDGFDANSRAFSYVIGRPWQLLFYSFVALVYGAITYLFIGAVLFLTLLAARTCLGAGLGAADAVFHTGGAGAARFEAMLKPPQIGQLSYDIDWSGLTTSGKIAAVLIQAWVYLFVGLLAAYAVSYFFCANTWIYLLLRRSADGTEFDSMHADAGVDGGGQEGQGAAAPPPPPTAPPPERVEVGGEAPGGAAGKPGAGPPAK